MPGPTVWRTLKFVIPGAGVGILLMGGWAWYAVPHAVSCTGPLTCTQVFIPGGLVAGVLLITGGLLIVGWSLIVGLQVLMQRFVVATNPVIANQP